jgi:hypothetical protein
MASSQTSNTIASPQYCRTAIRNLSKYKNLTSKATNIDPVTRYLPLSGNQRLLQEAHGVVHGLSGQPYVKEAQNFLAAMMEVLDFFEQCHIDLSNRRHLLPHIVDDGSILFEWAFNGYRVGFNLESNPQESSWYMVTSQDLGAITASGLLYGHDLNRLLVWIVTFIALRSEE